MPGLIFHLKDRTQDSLRSVYQKIKSIYDGSGKQNVKISEFYCDYIMVGEEIEYFLKIISMTDFIPDGKNEILISVMAGSPSAFADKKLSKEYVLRIKYDEYTKIKITGFPVYEIIFQSTDNKNILTNLDISDVYSVKDLDVSNIDIKEKLLITFYGKENINVKIKKEYKHLKEIDINGVMLINKNMVFEECNTVRLTNICTGGKKEIKIKVKKVNSIIIFSFTQRTEIVLNIDKYSGKETFMVQFLTLKEFNIPSHINGKSFYFSKIIGNFKLPEFITASYIYISSVELKGEYITIEADTLSLEKIKGKAYFNVKKVKVIKFFEIEKDVHINLNGIKHYKNFYVTRVKSILNAPKKIYIKNDRLTQNDNRIYIVNNSSSIKKLNVIIEKSLSDIKAEVNISVSKMSYLTLINESGYNISLMQIKKIKEFKLFRGIKCKHNFTTDYYYGQIKNNENGVIHVCGGFNIKGTPGIKEEENLQGFNELFFIIENIQKNKKGTIQKNRKKMFLKDRQLDILAKENRVVSWLFKEKDEFNMSFAKKCFKKYKNLFIFFNNKDKNLKLEESISEPEILAGMFFSFYGKNRVLKSFEETFKEFIDNNVSNKNLQKLTFIEAAEKFQILKNT